MTRTKNNMSFTDKWNMNCAMKKHFPPCTHLKKFLKWNCWSCSFSGGEGAGGDVSQSSSLWQEINVNANFSLLLDERGFSRPAARWWLWENWVESHHQYFYNKGCCFKWPIIMFWNGSYIHNEERWYYTNIYSDQIFYYRKRGISFPWLIALSTRHMWLSITSFARAFHKIAAAATGNKSPL